MASLWRRWTRGRRQDGAAPDAADGGTDGDTDVDAGDSAPTDLAQEEDAEEISLLVPAVQKVRVAAATHGGVAATSGDVTDSPAAGPAPPDALSATQDTEEAEYVAPGVYVQETAVRPPPASSAEGHGGQIEVESFSWGAEAAPSGDGPAGSAPGEAGPATPDLAIEADPAGQRPESDLEFLGRRAASTEPGSEPGAPAAGPGEDPQAGRPQMDDPLDLKATGQTGSEGVSDSGTGDVMIKGRPILQNAPVADGTSNTVLVGESHGAGEGDRLAPAGAGPTGPEGGGEFANPLRAAMFASPDAAGLDDEPTTLADLGQPSPDPGGAAGPLADIEALPDDAEVEPDEPEL